MDKQPTFTRPIEVASIPPGGLSRTVAATASEREALGKALGLLDLRVLTAEFELAPASGGVITVEGRVRAEIVQACVVSLVPVEQSIDEPVSVRFAPAGSPAAPPAKPGAEMMVDPHLTDPPDMLLEPTIDLAGIAVEHFMLAIDPYPRAPGAKLPEEYVEPPAAAGDSPFAALAGLREKAGRDG
jgi:uncharacterized metal-binding protein YceD (DUF177 family)